MFLLTLPRLSLSVKSVMGLAFCVPNYGVFMSQMGLSTILKREGCNRGDTLPFSDTLVAPLPTSVLPELAGSRGVVPGRPHSKISEGEAVTEG